MTARRMMPVVPRSDYRSHRHRFRGDEGDPALTSLLPVILVTTIALKSVAEAGTALLGAIVGYLWVRRLAAAATIKACPRIFSGA
jgi:hypothetical protein